MSFRPNPSSQGAAKEQYEARKKEREKLSELDFQLRQKQEQLLTLDMLDRFVTAVELLAESVQEIADHGRP